jgi:hypothetical protein
VPSAGSPFFSPANDWRAKALFFSNFLLQEFRNSFKLRTSLLKTVHGDTHVSV